MNCSQPNFVGDTFHGTTKSYGAQVVTSGEIWKLPAGPLALAGGLETHKEEFDQVFVEALNEGNITGYGGPIKSTEGKNRTQWAVFARVEHPDRQDARRQRRGPLRPLQRFRQHDEPEIQPAVATAAIGAGPRLLRHGLPRPDAVSELHAAVRRCVAAGADRPDPLPGHQRHRSRLQHAVQRALRRQRATEAGRVRAGDVGCRVRAHSRRVVQHRLLQDQPEERDPDGHCGFDDPLQT